MRFLPVLAMLATCWTGNALGNDDLWVTYKGESGPGKGKKIVLVSGDEEYRSEEALPQLGKILSKHHGFDCTVLFAIDPQTGEINPDYLRNIPGLEQLADADLMILFLRMRELPDEQMKHLFDYFESGRPFLALRTSTHPFQMATTSAYHKYDWRSKVTDWEGGFGKQVLGETWYTHHGKHGKESTRGIFAPGQEQHPILKGIASGDIWGPTDVYGVRLPLPGDAQPLVLGQILTGMNQDDSAVTDGRNDPMMPIAWTKTHTWPTEKTSRIFTTTMGASQDLLNESLRRMLVNACYWSLKMEEKIPDKANVDLVGDYQPSQFRFKGAKAGVKPADLK